jgi:hypothetical protein
MDSCTCVNLTEDARTTGSGSWSPSHFVLRLASPSIMKMEAEGSSKTSVSIYQTAPRSNNVYLYNESVCFMLTKIVVSQCVCEENYLLTSITMQ